MVDMASAKQMITTGINFPSDVDEIKFAGLTGIPSIKVGASQGLALRHGMPRISDSGLRPLRHRDRRGRADACP
ncbi:hypothetical protein [Aminobacter sp. DSM 101952]|uniref:hypothetical protein n=1 Tax=Aminobacter sp. DSM 101952 TaxID=2735891 RepID=UPI001803DC4F|nr:hypothetical protein [Aminobacter sp. DSM 101952]